MKKLNKLWVKLCKMAEKDRIIIFYDKNIN